MTTLLIGDVSGQQPNKPAHRHPRRCSPRNRRGSVVCRALPAASGALDRDRVYIPLQEGGTVALDRETGDVPGGIRSAGFGRSCWRRRW